MNARRIPDFARLVALISAVLAAAARPTRTDARTGHRSMQGGGDSAQVSDALHAGARGQGMEIPIATGDVVGYLAVGPDDPSDDGTAARRVSRVLAPVPLLQIPGSDVSGLRMVTMIERSLRVQWPLVLLLSGAVGFVVGLGLMRVGARSDLVRTDQSTEDDVNAEPETTVDVEPTEPSISTAPEAYEEANARLLADEEIVELMLRSEDGRMKQSEVVEATDWSKAKVSRLLSEMADEDAIVKIRLGRENLVCLESAQPDAAVSRQHDRQQRPGFAAGDD